jgi:predicted ATPase
VNTFSSIQLQGWRQFEHVDIQLDSRMTVLTGENGTGKTTILNVLSRHFGWNLHMISTPVSQGRQSQTRFWSDVWSMIDSDHLVEPGSLTVGGITYSDGQKCSLMAPPELNQAQYSLTYQNQQTVLGLHVPSHGPNFTYQRVDNIPTDPKTSQQQYQAYQSLLQQLYNGSPAQSPGRTLKESLIALAVFGYGNQVVVPNTEYSELFERFQAVLRVLLPKKIGFRQLEIRVPDIVFKTASGDFALDAASGGIGALVGLAWQILMYDVGQGAYVVTIDEPETHLHPSMQRELLPNLFAAFPSVQFIVATHSPFVVNSAPDARVYALIYNPQQRVRSEALDTADLAGSANETLREILGVPVSFPVWVEDRLRHTIQKYAAGPVTIETLRGLRTELADQGLEDLLPAAVDALGKTDA